MQTIGTIVALIGFALCLVGSIWLLIEAFKESILWGLGCLFLGFVSLIFIVVHWQRAKRPFILWLEGLALVLVAIFLLKGRIFFLGH
jgi:hypothetical protein